MSEVIAVQFGAMLDSAALLGTNADALERLVLKLRNDLLPLQLSWAQEGNSTAGQEAEQAHAVLEEALYNIIRTIRLFKANVNRTHDLMLATEMANTRMFA